ncbi:MAG: SulP family inorganic anion transporter, partial [Anaerolineales bacterium]
SMSLIKELKKELQPSLLLAGLTAGLIAAIVTISIMISLAALIWSGPLNQFLAGGIGLMLFGAFVIGVIVALTSSLPGVVAIPQDTPSAILALVAAGIAAAMKSAEPQALYSTVVAAIMLTSLLMAACFLLLGSFKASGFVRYVPYPVVGGFLAGTGFLLAKGAFGVMVDMPMTLANLPQLLTTGKLIEWLPGVVFAVALLLLLRRFDHFLITPSALILATALFYAYLFLAHISVADASLRGWLLGSLPGNGGLYRPLLPADFGQVDWSAILGQADKIATIMVLSAVALLLNASALEVTIRQDVDLDRELLSAGLANLISGLGGGSVGYQALGMSALAQRLGARSRLVNLISALLCGAALFFGASLISYFPKVMLGGMLLYLGLSFLSEWLIDARRVLPAIDYLLVWLILGIIVAFGFLQGIAAGVLIAAVLFVISYSRLNAIKNVLDGQSFQSNVDRPKAHRDLLMKHGAETFILRLQGFIFFGTIQAILERVRERLTSKEQPRLCYLVLDFQRVTRLDSSAVFGITRLKQLAVANGARMVWTQVSPTIQGQLQRGGLVDESDDSFIILPTLDHGVEWCENNILAAQGITDLTGFIERMEDQLERAFPNLHDVTRLTKYLDRREVPQGEYLMRQGDPPTEMYFVEGGLVTVQLEGVDGQVVRLRSIRGGATVGEMGLYLGAARTASVIAGRPSTVYRLSADALQDMGLHDPEVAALLHEWIARMLAERLAANNRTIEALLE